MIQNTKKIVIVQTAFLGDLLLSIPLLKTTRRIWPECEMTLVCRQGLGSFFLKTKLVDQVIEIQKGRSESYSQALQQLKASYFDILLAPHTSVRTALFCRTVKAKHKITFNKTWNKIFYHECLTWPSEWPEALRQLSLLAPFDEALKKNLVDETAGVRHNKKLPNNQLTPVPGWASMSMRDIFCSNQLVEEWLKIPEVIRSSVKQQSPIMIFPGSVWATKKWSAEGFLQLGESLQKKGHTILWMGGPGEESLVADLSRRLPGSFEIAGKTTILQSCLLMTQVELVIGNDSASSHMAAACDVPVVMIMGPTVLEFGYRPWTSKAAVVERDGLLCRPCGKHGAKKCPIKTHVCMTHISADEVLRQADIILRYNP